MNFKRLGLATFAVFLFMFFYEWVFHGVIMEGVYDETASIWRTDEQMQARFQFIVLGQLGLSAALSLLFAWGAKRGNIREGIAFGLILTLMVISSDWLMYAVAPYTTELVLNWNAGALIELLAVGILLGLIYKPRKIYTHKVEVKD